MPPGATGRPAGPAIARPGQSAQDKSGGRGAAAGGALGRQNRRHRNDGGRAPAPPPCGATITLTWVTPLICRDTTTLRSAQRCQRSNRAIYPHHSALPQVCSADAAAISQARAIGLNF
jgi:hypothetical protein